VRHAVRAVARWGLTLHIYLSMTGFLLVLLFAITGLTLNHDDFGLSEPRTTTSMTMVPSALLAHPDERAIVEHLRAAIAVRPPATRYREDPDVIELAFAAPGRRTTVTITRADGTARVESETRGLLGRIGDLHKGQDSGRAWKWLIDVTAVLLTLSAVTGIVTLLALPKRRNLALLVGLVSAGVLVAIYLVWVPR
jgi:hypothetical protein